MDPASENLRRDIEGLHEVGVQYVVVAAWTNDEDDTLEDVPVRVCTRMGHARAVGRHEFETDESVNRIRIFALRGHLFLGVVAELNTKDGKWIYGQPEYTKEQIERSKSHDSVPLDTADSIELEPRVAGAKRSRSRSRSPRK